jgi:hypothetical protein
MADPRLYQIGVLASLLVYGMAWLDFDITLSRAGVLLLTVVATQALCDRLDGRRPVNVKSALISGLSLCLLLRTNHTELAVLAAVVTIAAKFVVRFRGKHVFNPTNGGLVAMLLLTDQVWTSPGQWGSVAFFAFLMACLGAVVVNRVCVHRVLCRVGVRTLRVPRRADGDPASSTAERCAAALHLFHDFRSEDHTGFEGGSGAVCRGRGVRRVVRPVPPVQDERVALVPRGLLDGRTAHRPAAARTPVRVDHTTSEGARG